MGFFEKIFGSKSDREVKKLKDFVDEVNSFSSYAQALKDEDFPKKTQEYKLRIKNGEKPSSFKAEAFALVREASYRCIGERPYDVQIMGAAVLDDGKILEMKTGEGKTLTSSIAAYFNALRGEGVHVITVNDYLAERDAEWMGVIYRFMGLSVGCVLSTMDNEARKDAYSKDITYGTNNEFGFDYLRDNMKYRAEDKIQANHAYCIIDEIDSILIDEARTPLIISAPDDDDSAYAVAAARIAPAFKECEKDPETGTYYELDPLERKFTKDFDDKGDFKLDEKSKNITITRSGYMHMEELLNKSGAISGSLYDPGAFEYVHYVTQALKALYMYKKDIDYIVADGKVQIVDEFTGRILEGRRYSEGLHQAIEAKEHLKILSKSKTLATITIQNFFRMYKKISGMTGTAITEEQEFASIYNLEVVVIPTNKPLMRIDADDYIFFNEKYKYEAVTKEVKRVHSTGQPILVGTVSIEKSELLSKLFTRAGIPHNVLNAKNHAREAMIIAEAGAKGAVTIATNMAGRGTDIKLGGSIENLAYKKCSTHATPEEFKKAKEEVREEFKKREDEVKALGGLYILGTERHESRRIDNQLRGRSGRQGDPGFSRFYVSLDDDLMRIFASDSVRGFLSKAGMDTPEPLEHKMVTRAIEKAQKSVEERNFTIRKNLLEYDDVINEQREFIYTQRDSIIEEKDVPSRIKSAIASTIESLVDNKDNERLSSLFSSVQPSELPDPKLSDEDKKKAYIALGNKVFDEKMALVSGGELAEFMRYQYLRMIDSAWQDHLSELEALRESVYLRSYASKNPLTEYKVEGSETFENLIANLRVSIGTFALLVKISVKESAQPQTRRPISERGTARKESFDSSYALSKRRESAAAGQGENIQVVRTAPKVGRNDPCPCGSGKKYKHCCGK